jgi:ABC-2 type transport system permease protein
MTPFFWHLRREAWEHRALLWAPMITLAIVVIGLLSDFRDIPLGMQALAEHAAGRVGSVLGALHLILAVPFAIVMAIVAAFYSLDCLHAERRDRSVLFWKSLPVSDLATVLSKLAVVALPVPLITFVAAIAAQLLAMTIASVSLSVAGQSAAALWTETPIITNTGLLLYGLFVQSLWYLPLYAWILLASAWAQRGVTLWAVLPPLAVILLEQMVFQSNHFVLWLKDRLAGIFPLAFRVGDNRMGIVIDDDTIDVPEHMIEVVDPTAVLSSGAFWFGLALAAALIAATVWIRRYREPI